MNLVLIDPAALGADGSARLTGDAARHLMTVLAVGLGSRVRVGVLNGARGVGTVVSIARDEVRLACVLESQPPPRPTVDLLLALPRPKVMRRLWAQVAALGVGRILVTNAARVERNYFDTHVLGPDCYRPLLVEGLQQAQDTWLPVVTVHRRFKVLVEDELEALCPGTRRLVAHPSGIAADEGALAGSAQRVLLAVGPEGGWDDYELSVLASHGFTRLSLGPRTLRSDTATIALVAIVHRALARFSVPPDSIADR